MNWVPPQGHLQGQTRDNTNTRFFTLKKNTYVRVLLKHQLDLPVDLETCVRLEIILLNKA